MDEFKLFLALFMTVIGAAYMVYGKKRPAPSFLVAGLVMSFAGYFTSDFWLTLLIAAVLCVAPFFLRFGE